MWNTHPLHDRSFRGVNSIGRVVQSLCVRDVKQTGIMQGVLCDIVNEWSIKCGKQSCVGGEIHT